MSGYDYGGEFRAVDDMLGEYQETIRERAEKVNQLADMRVSYASGDGLIQVTVNTDGLLLDLHVSPSLTGHSPDRIGVAIMEVYQAAQQAAAGRAAEVMRATFGASSSQAAKYRDRLEPDPESGPSTPASDDHDDDSPEIAHYRA